MFINDGLHFELGVNESGSCRSTSSPQNPNQLDLEPKSVKGIEDSVVRAPNQKLYKRLSFRPQSFGL